MAKKRITKTIETCDRCGRETTILETCLVCRREFCLTCDAIIPGCITSPTMCKDCGDRYDVQKIVVGKYAPRLRRIHTLRAKELAALPRKAPKLRDLK